MGLNSKIFTFEEVAKHNQEEDCWIIVNGKVYDVTTYLNDHPGGYEPLLIATGKDATDDFEDIGHSDEAIDEMKKFFVGEIDTSTLPAKAKYTPPPPPPPHRTQAPAAVGNQQSSGFVVKVLKYVWPLLIFGLAFALQQRYGSNE